MRDGDSEKDACVLLCARVRVDVLYACQLHIHFYARVPFSIAPAHACALFPSFAPLLSVSCAFYLFLSPHTCNVHCMLVAWELVCIIDERHPAPFLCVHTQMSPPATRDSVQWADHQDSRNFAMPASDEHWQSGDLDVRLAKPRTLIRNPEP